LGNSSKKTYFSKSGSACLCKAEAGPFCFGKNGRKPSDQLVRRLYRSRHFRVIENSIEAVIPGTPGIQESFVCSRDKRNAFSSVARRIGYRMNYKKPVPPAFARPRRVHFVSAKMDENHLPGRHCSFK